MAAAAEAGATTAPPVPAMYARPTSIEDMVDHTARRVLARLGLVELAASPWRGLQEELRGGNGEAAS